MNSSRWLYIQSMIFLIKPILLSSKIFSFLIRSFAYLNSLANTFEPQIVYLYICPSSTLAGITKEILSFTTCFGTPSSNLVASPFEHEFFHSLFSQFLVLLIPRLWSESLATESTLSECFSPHWVRYPLALIFALQMGVRILAMSHSPFPPTPFFLISQILPVRVRLYSELSGFELSRVLYGAVVTISQPETQKPQWSLNSGHCTNIG